MLKSGIYDFVICRGGTDMCFVLGFGRKRPDLKQYRISGLTWCWLWDDDDDLNDACDDGDDDGDDLPLREVFSPAESARRKCLFFCVGFRHGAAAELRKLFSF